MTTLSNIEFAPSVRGRREWKTIAFVSNRNSESIFINLSLRKELARTITPKKMVSIVSHEQLHSTLCFQSITASNNLDNLCAYIEDIDYTGVMKA